jgi:DNA helicase-2/ATP-dependent DNA helicase PcrA
VLELREEGIELRDIAVLYRAHYHSMEVQMEFTRHGIPFQITSGLRFFEQAHVKDVAAFLKFAVNPRDEVAFKRMARLLPGIGSISAESLWAKVSAFPDLAALLPQLPTIPVPAKAAKAWKQLAHTLDELAPAGVPQPPGEMIHSVIEAIYDDYAKAEFPNYEARREDLKTLANFAKQYTSPGDFLDQLALLTNLDHEASAHEDETEMATLSSVHQAKGLEWKAVFVIWMTDGMFPSSRSLESDEAVEEERRLFYVAVTRAKDELYLTYPHMRLNAGYGEMMQRPSRFLAEVPKVLLEEWQVGGGAW